MTASLADVRSLTQALARVPGGTEAARAITALGLWSSETHRSAPARLKFPRSFADLSPSQLSDLAARVAVEASRLIELVGLLKGLQAQLKVEDARARAAARVRARRAAADTTRKPPSVAELTDLTEEDAAVRDSAEALALVAMLLAAAEAAKEATFVMKESVSREISYRCAQLDARVY